MDEYTIILSGPKSAVSQARTALGGAGLAAMDTPTGHGLPDRADGQEVKQAVAFLTVRGDASTVDRAHRAVATVGWTLRAHYHTPPEPEPSQMDRVLAEMLEMRAEIDALKGAEG